MFPDRTPPQKFEDWKARIPTARKIYTVTSRLHRGLGPLYQSIDAAAAHRHAENPDDWEGFDALALDDGNLLYKVYRYRQCAEYRRHRLPGQF